MTDQPTRNENQPIRMSDLLGETILTDGAPWTCSCGHTIGHNRKIETPDMPYIHRLFLMNGDVIEGAAWIHCPACGQVKKWLPEHEAIKKLMSHYA